MNAEDWLHCWVRPERYYVALKAINEFHWLCWVFIRWVERVCWDDLGDSSHDWYIGVSAILYHCPLFRIMCMCFLYQTLGVFGWSICSPRKPLRIWWVDIRWLMSRATVTTPFSQCWVQYLHSHLICLWVFSWLIDGWFRLINRHQFTHYIIIHLYIIYILMCWWFTLQDLHFREYSSVKHVFLIESFVLRQASLEASQAAPPGRWEDRVKLGWAFCGSWKLTFFFNQASYVYIYILIYTYIFSIYCII